MEGDDGGREAKMEGRMEELERVEGGMERRRNGGREIVRLPESSDGRHTGRSRGASALN